MKQELCSGVIPVSCKRDEICVLLVQHRKGSYWGFPKGHLSNSEDIKIAAVRELREETNLEVLRFLEIDPLQEQYIFFRSQEEISKTVWYYIAETTTIFSTQREEILDAKWVKLQELLSYASHASSRALMKQARDVILEFYKEELL
ncbi:MAG: NUDIX domain-containing protein [Chlamydiales bacterium]